MSTSCSSPFRGEGCRFHSALSNRQRASLFEFRFLAVPLLRLGPFLLHSFFRRGRAGESGIRILLHLVSSRRSAFYTGTLRKKSSQTPAAHRLTPMVARSLRDNSVRNHQKLLQDARQMAR